MLGMYSNPLIYLFISYLSILYKMFSFISFVQLPELLSLHIKTKVWWQVEMRWCDNEYFHKFVVVRGKCRFGLMIYKLPHNVVSFYLFNSIFLSLAFSSYYYQYVGLEIPYLLNMFSCTFSLYFKWLGLTITSMKIFFNKLSLPAWLLYMAPHTLYYKS